MNNRGKVRLEALRIYNFKNVNYGEIEFSEHKKLNRGEYDEDSFSNTLGIYGQNGSGKTTAISALRFLQTLLSGSPIKRDLYLNYISVGQNEMGIEADFLVKNENGIYYVTYSYFLERFDGIQKNQLRTKKEKISLFKFDDNRKKTLVYSYTYPQTISKNFTDKIKNSDTYAYMVLSQIESNSLSSNGRIISTIFNLKLLRIIYPYRDQSLKEYWSILTSLFYFGSARIAIYTTGYFNDNDKVGIRFRIKKEDEEDPIGFNVEDLFVPFGKGILEESKYNTFIKTIENINKVLPSIVKDCKILIEKSPQKNIVNNETLIEFYLFSLRNGKKIPLIFESNGIKKIVSILSGLIDAFNNEGNLIVIDELDSGVFEFLLGELIYAFSNFSEGQLIFTSHNLRVLEKCNHNDICFTTQDSNNVYVKIDGIKQTNNFRDIYLRYILNDAKGNHQLYDYVDTDKLISDLYISK